MACATTSLAGAAFALNENGGVSRGDFLDHLEDVLHERAAPPDDIAGGNFGRLRLAQVEVFALQAAKRLQATEEQVELRGQHGLDQVIEQTDADGFHGRIHRGVAGHQDAVGARRDLANLAQEIEAVAVFQAEIGHHDIKRVAFERLMRLQGGAGAEDGVALARQVIDEHATQLFVVIDHQDLI